MNWRTCVASWVVLGTLALTACKDEKSPTETTGAASAPGGQAAALATLPRLTDEVPPSVSTARPDAKGGDDPEADYKTLDQVYKGGEGADGKKFLFRGFGTPLGPQLSHLSECKVSTERTNIVAATFPVALRNTMRAMPSTQYVAEGQCPRVLVKITGFHKTARYPLGEVLEVYDVKPDPAPKKLPVGVDFVSMDDLFLAGPAAVGKAADFGVWAGPKDRKANSWQLVATGCSPHSGSNAHLYVEETDSNRAFIEALRKAGQSTCARVRAKILKAPIKELQPRWVAELVGVGDLYPKPHPPPNP